MADSKTIPATEQFEKLGAFYLGRPYDPTTKTAQPGLILYDSKDLVTHAVCVGMTGSGKTGLCIDLLEEAALDGIPAIAIDPKGDLTNLMLAFPDLRPQDFRPWINEDDARAKSMSPDDYATQQAKLWKDGLASWGQDGDRIRRLKDAADTRWRARPRVLLSGKGARAARRQDEQPSGIAGLQRLARRCPARRRAAA